MESVPKTLDWVTARAECSVGQLFMLLIKVVESDVKTRQARASQEGAQFKVERLTDTTVMVIKTWWEARIHYDDGVSFEMTPTTIEAKGARNTRTLFTAKPSLDSTGTCRLEIDGQSMELWQVSRKALEDLFFS